MSIRVVQYNVLCPNLCKEDDFVKSVGHTDEEIRWQRILNKLTPEMEKKSVITLQEVGRKWGGRFQTFFNSKNYRFIYQGHGNEMADFMGQAIAFHESFELLDCRFLSPFCKEATNFEWKPSPKRMTGYFPMGLISAGALAASFIFPSQASRIAKASLTTLLLSSFYFHFESQKSPLSNYHPGTGISISVGSRSRDVIPMVKLRGSDDLGNVAMEFWVATNHMPCKFKNLPLMAVYTGFTVKAVQDVAQNDPYILAGDFNQDPDTDCYRLMTEGSDTKIEVDVDEYLPLMKPMRSAYAVVGGEPEYTNYCDRIRFGDFVGTLDFIWLSKHWEVTSVDPVPDIEVESWPCETEPSDHCIIAADLTLKM